MSNFSAPFNFEDMECNNLQQLSKGLTENWKRAKEYIYSGKLLNWLKKEEPKLAEYISYIIDNTERYLVNNELDDKKDVGTFFAIYTINSDIDKIYWKGIEYANLEELASNVSKDKTICNLFMNSAISLILKIKNVKDENLIERIQKIEKFSINNALEGAYRFQYEFSNNQNIYVKDKTYKNIDAIIDEFDLENKNFYQFLDDVISSDSFKARIWKDGYSTLCQKYPIYGKYNKLVKTSLILKLFEEISKNNKEKVREYALLKGKYSHIYWLKTNLNDYEYRGEKSTELRLKIQNKNISKKLDIANQEKELEEMKVDYYEFTRLVIKNPYDITYGVLQKEDIEECIIPLTIDSMFLAEINDEPVTLSYLKSIERIDNLKHYLKNINAYNEEAKSKFANFEMNFKQQKKNIEQEIKTGAISNVNSKLIIKLILVIIIFICTLKFLTVNFLEIRTINLVDKALVKTYEKVDGRTTNILNDIKNTCMKETGYTEQLVKIPELNMPVEEKIVNDEIGNVNLGEQYIKNLEILTATVKIMLAYAVVLGTIEIFLGNKVSSSSMEKKIQILEDENNLLNKHFSETKDSLDYKIEQGEFVEVYLNELTSKSELSESINFLNSGALSNQAKKSGIYTFLYYAMSIVNIIAVATFYILPLFILLELIIKKEIALTIIKVIVYILTSISMFNYVTKNIFSYSFSEWVKQILHFIIRIIISIFIISLFFIKFFK